MRSTVSPDVRNQLDRLATLLRHQPFEPETERKFCEKWEELVNQYEAENPGIVPPLLEFADNEWNTCVRWPKGWR